MGTNYYTIKNDCLCCNRYDTEYHIGKSSHGWAFTFRGYPAQRLTSWATWKEFLKTQSIRNEYGDTVLYEDLVDMIESHKAPGFVADNGHKNLQHNQEGKTNKYPYFNPDYDWDDELGYPFCSREFS